MLGAQSSRPRRAPEVTIVRPTVAVALLCCVSGLLGCASRADLIAQDRRLSQQLGDQRRQIQSMQRELERLRGDMEGGPRKGGEAAASAEQRIQELEDRLARLEGHPPPGGEPVEPPTFRDVPPPIASTPPPPPRETAPPPPPPAATAPADDTWARDVARDQQAVAASTAPEKAEFEGMLDSVAKKDCGRAVNQLNTFAAQKKESPLASSALYWVARCHALRGDKNQAISKFYDVVTKYPRGTKAPAALWEQGNLFIDMGDTPDARLALGKLIKDYPSSNEAGLARKRLTELDR
jgi:tol-pal system protein YbgF